MSGLSLLLTRWFAAPPEAVFDAWVNPAVLREWWAAAEGWTGAQAETDVRVGGRFRLGMAEPDTGLIRSVAGEYLEVRRPERLVYTWTWEGKPPEMEGSEGTIVTVEFRPEGSGTTVVLVHDGFATEHARDLHTDGWDGCLANLTGRVFPTREGNV